MDDKRAEYLQFHHESVFKGSYDFAVAVKSTYTNVKVEELKAAESIDTGYSSRK